MGRNRGPTTHFEFDGTVHRQTTRRDRRTWDLVESMAKELFTRVIQFAELNPVKLGEEIRDGDSRGALDTFNRAMKEWGNQQEASQVNPHDPRRKE